MADANHTVQSKRYASVRCDGHPLADSTGRLYRHRLVLYRAIGPGPHRCHWCGVEICWATLHVDHLNEQTRDNRVENLVPSCPTCNMARGFPKMRQTKKAQGRILTAHGLTMCVSDWSRHLGLARWTIMGRLAKGMAPEDALTAERSRCGPVRRKVPRPDHVVDVSAVLQENAP